MSSSNSPPHSPNNTYNTHTHSQTHSHALETVETVETAEHQSLIADYPPKKNCCTWKVATLFLAAVAAGLVVTWKMLPAEDIVIQYLPKFEEPAVPYSGPEAGVSGGGGGGGDGGGGDVSSGGGGDGSATGSGDTGQDSTSDFDISQSDITTTDPSNPSNPSDPSAAGTTVPSYMQCPNPSNILNARGQAKCCNGSPSNCILRVDQMMFGMVHNANAAEEGEFYFGFNHRWGLEKALVAGYRGINLDVCSCGGVLQFCHNVCDLGERYPNEVFTNIQNFLTDYRSEVIVLLFEASTEQGPISWNDLYSEMEGVEVDGTSFVDLLYVHDGGEWPTMATLVEQNKRIIVFYFNNGSCTNNLCPTPFHYFYTYASETQFQSETTSDLQNYDYSCQITRGPDPPNAAGDFFVVNNFVTPPDESAARVANGQEFLAERLTKCANLNGRRPNFIYLDFWSEGVTAELIQYANAQFAESLSQ